MEFKFSFQFEKQSKFQKLSNFGTVRPFDIPHHSQFVRFLYLPFDLNFIFYCSDSRKFGRYKLGLSLIFKFEISAILIFYCSKFWPSSEFIGIKKKISTCSLSHNLLGNTYLARKLITFGLKFLICCWKDCVSRLSGNSSTLLLTESPSWFPRRFLLCFAVFWAPST